MESEDDTKVLSGVLVGSKISDVLDGKSENVVLSATVDGVSGCKVLTVP